jgi:hypothetical protein
MGNALAIVYNPPDANSDHFLNTPLPEDAITTIPGSTFSPDQRL